MPPGDRQRTWFPEIIDRLRSEWNPDASLNELIELSQQLDSQLREIRATRGLKPPIIQCRHCGRIGPAGENRVSVRAMILAAFRFGIESPTVTKGLERRWAKYRAERQLDPYGQPTSRPKAHCGHSKLVSG